MERALPQVCSGAFAAVGLHQEPPHTGPLVRVAPHVGGAVRDVISGRVPLVDSLVPPIGALSVFLAWWRCRPSSNCMA